MEHLMDLPVHNCEAFSRMEHHNRPSSSLQDAPKYLAFADSSTLASTALGWRPQQQQQQQQQQQHQQAAADTGAVTVSNPSAHINPLVVHMTKQVILCGDAGVGKTCLIERMFSNKFELTLPSTIGTDQRFKRLKVDGVHIGVSVWDTAGQDRFQSLTPMYFRGAHGVVYVFDVTQPETLDSLANKWMDDFRQYSTHPEAVQMVVGNKIDLAADARAVTSDQGAAFARAHGCLYKETSAKEDCGGVEEGVYDALFGAWSPPS
ncbi:P-loop containing nucleoside triphosphate hydrolase protein [Scenedesmus sp. NREL 46B-D3]|nr:P-loop containing nucleoside triphosphate hydrolase protein [Scenedesmus sp. NREL 46B-D3]